MNTTPKKPYKYHDVATAFFEGANIQYRKDASVGWTDTQDPNWFEDFEYRVKPAAPVYPETQMTHEELCMAGNISLTDIMTASRPLANAAIRRAIEDGQVVRADDEAHKAFDKRLALAEAALLDAGFERLDVEGNWKKSDVVDAEFVPEPHQDSQILRHSGLPADHWEKECKKVRTELADCSRKYSDRAYRVGRAVAVFLDHSSSIPDEVLSAIVMLEKAKESL